MGEPRLVKKEFFLLTRLLVSAPEPYALIL
jgi:hypothetical protein